MMTDQEHTRSLRERLEAAKAERRAQDLAFEDLDALLSREDRYARVEPGQLAAAEKAFDEALGEEVSQTPPAAPKPTEQALVPAFALFA